MKQTSDRVSSIAARYVRTTGDHLRSRITAHPDQADATAADIRSMAASLLAQDEVGGLRKLWKKVTGQ